jgi:amino acid permease
MIQKIEKYKKRLTEFEKQRKVWIQMSSFVCLGLLILYLDWDYIVAHGWQKHFAILGLMISAAWWYWTMCMIRVLVRYKLIELKILAEIMEEIGNVKNDVRKNYKEH